MKTIAVEKNCFIAPGLPFARAWAKLLFELGKKIEQVQYSPERGLSFSGDLLSYLA